MVNPVKKSSILWLQSSTDLFRTGKKKHELGEEHDTCLLLKSYYSYGNVFYFVT